jgi:RimJ/RimL family protein N-acetyltransferase
MEPLPLSVHTPRLQLVAATVESARADLDDVPALARLLDATIAPQWPPPLNDRDSQSWTLRYLERHPEAVGWCMWYFVLRTDRTAVGVGGFKGLPAPDGTVEVGYSVLETHQRRGYASEAVEALVGWAFGHPEVTRVIAETYPELVASVGVLEKTGFHCVGAGSEERVIRFERLRVPARNGAGAAP